MKKRVLTKDSLVYTASAWDEMGREDMPWIIIVGLTPALVEEALDVAMWHGDWSPGTDETAFGKVRSDVSKVRLGKMANTKTELRMLISLLRDSGVVQQ
jgi:hypothetical protein